MRRVGFYVGWGMCFTIRQWTFLGAALGFALGAIAADEAARDEAVAAAIAAAKNPEASFEEAYQAAVEAGVEEARLLELRFVGAMAGGDVEGLYGIVDELEAVIDDLEYGGSNPFASARQLRGVLATLRAVEAYQAEDYERFEALAVDSFLNAPAYTQAFGLMRFMSELRSKEAQESAMADFRVPMDMEIASVEGETKTLEGWLGSNQALLIDFWASWCGPCIRLMPELKEKAASLSGQGIFVAGFNTDDSDQLSKAKQVRNRHGMGSVPWLIDPGGSKLSGMLYVDSIPRMVLIGPEGKVHFNGHPMDPSLGKALAKFGAEL